MLFRICFLYPRRLFASQLQYQSIEKQLCQWADRTMCVAWCFSLAVYSVENSSRIKISKIRTERRHPAPTPPDAENTIVKRPSNSLLWNRKISEIEYRYPNTFWSVAPPSITNGGWHRSGSDDETPLVWILSGELRELLIYANLQRIINQQWYCSLLKMMPLCITWGDVP